MTQCWCKDVGSVRGWAVVSMRRLQHRTPVRAAQPQHSPALLRTSINDTMRVTPYTPICNTTHLIFRLKTMIYGLHKIHLRDLFAAI